MDKMKKDIALSVETLILSDFITKLKAKLDDLSLEGDAKIALVEFIDEQTLPAAKIKKVVNKTLAAKVVAKKVIKEENRCTMTTKAGNPCKAPRTTDGKCWKHLSPEEQATYLENKPATPVKKTKATTTKSSANEKA